MTAGTSQTAYEPVIGLEVHAQLRTRTKIFCGCATTFGSAPNENTCPVCLGLPGALPVLNRRAVEMALRMGLAVGAEPRSPSVFARKNYFYPDLPKGYQISQYDLPVCEGGSIPIETESGNRTIRLNRIHLEEDAGKLIHGLPGGGESDRSYVDYNRAGVPLIEIVSEPEVRSYEEATRYLMRLRSLVTYLGICDGNMEEGSLRCDANVSIRPRGSKELGTRTELKNLNSFRHVQKALEFEVARQTEILDSGGQVVQETRLWDEEHSVTASMRSKEEAHDYRYFPDPDLPTLSLSEEWIQELKGTIPELPHSRRQRFMDSFGLSPVDADLLAQERALADYFEAACEASGNPRAAGNWVRGELLGLLNDRHLPVADSPIGPEHLGQLIRLVDDGTISGKIAKQVFEEMAAGGGAPAAIVEKLGLVQITDEDAIASVVEQVIEAHPEPAAQYREGKTAVLGFLVGQAMKATSGKANPGLVNRLLRARLGEPAGDG
jgi:aspartyl-tRNA(Asn)/glutamyl-tRNA(Gln) amidotransferase subunit B